MLGRRREYRVKRWHIVFFVLLALATGLLRLFRGRLDTARILVSGERLSVLLPETVAEFKRGLGGMETLAPYDGMLFVYETPSRPAMVMRDMHFPLDFIWFLRGQVVDIAPRVETEPGVPEAGLTHYAPRSAADMVLELPAGWAWEHGLKIGDTMTFE